MYQIISNLIGHMVPAMGPLCPKEMGREAHCKGPQRPNKGKLKSSWQSDMGPQAHIKKGPKELKKHFKNLVLWGLIP